MIESFKKNKFDIIGFVSVGGTVFMAASYGDNKFTFLIGLLVIIASLLFKCMMVLVEVSITLRSMDIKMTATMLAHSSSIMRDLMSDSDHKRPN